MYNVTLSAPEHLIRAGRERAVAQGTTLNAAFREWLAQFAAQPSAGKRALELMQQAAQLGGSGGQRFSREERNERTR